jgi:vesicle transport through interaction with t-SNAREs protein 1
MIFNKNLILSDSKRHLEPLSENLKKMSDIFAQYEKEFLDLKSAIQDKLKSEIKDLNSVKKLGRELEELEEILGTMELETNTLPAATKVNLTPKVKIYKEEFKSLKKNFLEFKGQSTSTERDLLLSSNDGNKNRSRLLDGTERLEQGNKRLEEARRVALDTEQIGISTLEDLNRQREQLERTGNTLNTADSWIAKSQGIYNSSEARVLRP